MPDKNMGHAGNRTQQARVVQKGATGNSGFGGQGRGWHGDSVGHAEAGRAGGEAVSRDRSHMAEIGRKGGETVSKDRRHMAAIGRQGGEVSGGTRSTSQPRSRRKHK